MHSRAEPATYLRAMPLHAITEVYGEPGLRDRWTLETRALPAGAQRPLADALAFATDLHAEQRRVREPYLNHLLRVAIRILHYYRVTDVDVLVAALLHDSVEDQPWAITGRAEASEPPPRAQAVQVLSDRFGARPAGLVTAATNPVYHPGRDRHAQYREHLTTALAADPWARVIKLSDFTDNGVGIIHTAGPKLRTSAGKYDPVVPILRELLNRPDTPLSAAVKRHIAAQLDLARQRFAAILAA